MKLILILVSACLAIAAPPPAVVHFERYGEDSSLMINGARPLEAAAAALKEHYGVSLGVEDPISKFPGDPQTLQLVVHFKIDRDGLPLDIGQLLQSLADSMNAKTPFAYQVSGDGRTFFLVPTRTRDSAGREVDGTPLMDLPVTILPARRSVLEQVSIMAQDIAGQARIHVSASVAGPSAKRNLLFSAEREPARSVLKRLGLSVWHTRCVPRGCEIYVP